MYILDEGPHYFSYKIFRCCKCVLFFFKKKPNNLSYSPNKQKKTNFFFNQTKKSNDSKQTNNIYIKITITCEKKNLYTRAEKQCCSIFNQLNMKNDEIR